jgi:deazaflavin-dependent oxidoreductase (nitroreductase family)
VQVFLSHDAASTAPTCARLIVAFEERARLAGMAQTKIDKRVMRIWAAGHRLLLRLSGGRFGRQLQGGEVILVATTGRRSGKARERQLIGGEHEDGWIVIASYSGHDEHPAWYLNLQANPAATVRTRSGTHQVRAREAEGEERQELWDQMVGQFSDFAEYQKVSEREIPVVVLERQEA